MAEELVERFFCKGTPSFPHVENVTFFRSTYEEARSDGEQILRAGNWLMFKVEKVFILKPKSD